MIDQTTAQLIEGPIGLPQPDLLPPQIPPRNEFTRNHPLQTNPPLPTNYSITTNQPIPSHNSIPANIQPSIHHGLPTNYQPSTNCQLQTNHPFPTNHVPLTNHLPQNNHEIPNNHQYSSNHLPLTNHIHLTNHQDQTNYPLLTNHQHLSNYTLQNHSLPNHLPLTTNHQLQAKQQQPTQQQQYRPQPIVDNKDISNSGFPDQPIKIIDNNLNQENRQTFLNPVSQPVKPVTKPAKSLRSLDYLDTVATEPRVGVEEREGGKRGIKRTDMERGKERDLMHLKGPFTEAAVIKHLHQRWMENKFQVSF